MFVIVASIESSSNNYIVLQIYFRVFGTIMNLRENVQILDIRERLSIMLFSFQQGGLKVQLVGWFMGLVKSLLSQFSRIDWLAIERLS